MPTLHLVADNIQTKEGFDISSGGRIPIRSVTLSCHVQSDRPLEYDTLVLVDMERGIDVERTTEVRKFLVILAGETQSTLMTYFSGYSGANPFPWWW